MCRTPWVEAKAGVRPTELLAKTGSRSVVAPVASRHLFNSLKEFRHPGISPPPQCLFVPYRVSPPRVCLILSCRRRRCFVWPECLRLGLGLTVRYGAVWPQYRRSDCRNRTPLRRGPPPSCERARRGSAGAEDGRSNKAQITLEGSQRSRDSTGLDEA